MPEQKITIVRQRILRLIWIVMSLLVIWFRGDLSPRAAPRGAKPRGPPVEITTVDPGEDGGRDIPKPQPEGRC